LATSAKNETRRVSASSVAISANVSRKARLVRVGLNAHRVQPALVGDADQLADPIERLRVRNDRGPTFDMARR